MHATPTPRTKRVTRTAYGNGARPGHLWCLSLQCTCPCAVLQGLIARPHGASERALHWPQGA
eukprot:1223483-Pleurochrysis_carterae.AAC.1